MALILSLAKNKIIDEHFSDTPSKCIKLLSLTFLQT